MKFPCGSIVFVSLFGPSNLIRTCAAVPIADDTRPLIVYRTGGLGVTISSGVGVGETVGVGVAV